MSKIQDKLYRYLEDAVAMETQTIEILQKQVPILEKHPDIQAHIQRHLVESEAQRDRLREHLKALGRSDSPVKNAVGNVIGNLQGLFGGLRDDTLAHMARDSYTIEHLEIASYTLLATTARLAGDPEAERIAEQNMQEEIAMATWLAEQLPDAFMRDLAAAGVTITPTMTGLSHVAPRLHVTFDTGDVDARMPANITRDTGMDAP